MTTATQERTARAQQVAKKYTDKLWRTDAFVAAALELNKINNGVRSETIKDLEDMQGEPLNQTQVNLLNKIW